MDMFDNLPPALTLVLGMLLLVWLVLLLLVPFMIESIRGWSRRSCQELEEMNSKLDALTTLLSDRGDLRRETPRVEPELGDLTAVRVEARPQTGRYAEPADERGARRRPDRARKEPTI